MSYVVINENYQYEPLTDGKHRRVSASYNFFGTRGTNHPGVIWLGIER